MSVAPLATIAFERLAFEVQSHILEYPILFLRFSPFPVTVSNAVVSHYTFERVRLSIHYSHPPPETSRCVNLKTLVTALVLRLIFISGNYDVTRSGRYTIVNCGSRDAARLTDLLDSLWAVLQPSIRDASLTDLTDPSSAFRTFFKSSNNAPYVSQLLTNVTTGVSLYPPQQHFHQTGSPLLICATGGGQIVGKHGGIDYYYQCLLDPYDSLIAISGTPYIVVCPYLFSSGVPDLPPANTCLTINTYLNGFREMGLDYVKFKVWTLLEGILKYYIYATTGSNNVFATNVNKCIRLGARQMVQNPRNYVYYVASQP